MTTRTLKKAGLIIASSMFVAATTSCKDNDPNPGCTGVHRSGPAIVTIACTTEARAESLPHDTLRVEFTDEHGQWIPCTRYMGEDTTNKPYTQPVCDAAKPTTPKFDCGHSVGTFEIRATQGDRTAGPIEIKTRMKNACAYDDKTLYHELTLDLP